MARCQGCVSAVRVEQTSALNIELPLEFLMAIFAIRNIG